MKNILIIGGMFAGSWIGWLAGDALHFGILGSFLLSSVVSIAGLYGGWKIARHFDL